ncbi:MAG: alpha/beta fold hydrolase [Rhodospirillales bacterium]
MSAAPREQRHKLKTTEICTFVSGGGAPPVIFLHGITGSAGVWEPIAARVAERYTAVAVDQRGHGRSGRPAGEVYNAEDYAGDVAGLIDALGLGPAVLVGHSLGARNAMVAGALYPDRVRGVFAIDLTPFIPTSEWEALEQRVGGGDRTFGDEAEVRAYLADRYKLMPPEAIALRARYGYANVKGRLAPLADPAAMMATCRGFRPDFVDAFRRLAVPTVLVRGADSPVVNRETWAKARALRPDLRAVEVEGTDHYVSEEKPGLIADMVMEFVAELTATKAATAKPEDDGIQWSAPALVRRGEGGRMVVELPENVVEACAIHEGDVVNFTAFPSGAIEFWSIKKGTYSSLDDAAAEGRLAQEAKR